MCAGERGYHETSPLSDNHTQPGGAVEGSGQAYETLLTRLSRSFPEIARHIRDEVLRGQDVPGENTALSAYPGAKPRSSEITTREYADDEKLEILLSGLITTVRTAIESRQAIAAMMVDGDTHGGTRANISHAARDSRITFVDTDTDQYVLTMSTGEISGYAELESIQRGLEQALTLIRET
jgi:hypothetical protein